MPTLLEKLKPKNSPAEKPAGQTPAAAEPCSVCGCHILWLDVYAGPVDPWRCFRCEPPPVEALVARWHDCLAPGRSTDAPSGRNAGDEASVAHGRDWESYDLADSAGERWAVTRIRRTKSHDPRRDVSLARWAAELRT